MIFRMRTALTMPKVAGLVALALSVGACEDLILTDQTLTITGTGIVAGTAYFDANGNGQQDGGDFAYEGLRLKLVTLAGGEVPNIDIVTDDKGDFEVSPVPVGSFRLTLDQANAPDTVQVFGLDDPEPLIVEPGRTESIVVRVTFPAVSLAEARASPPGRHVITHGIALSNRSSVGDGVVHFQDGDTYIRALQVDRSSLAPGDSVRLVGTTAMDQGQPVLTQVTPIVLINQAVLVSPIDVTTASAAAANGGVLDAAFVAVENATVTAVTAVGDHFVVTVDDGSGPVDLVLRSFIFGSDPPGLVPNVDVLAQAQGLLVPVLDGQSQTRWQMNLRFTGDIEVAQGGQ